MHKLSFWLLQLQIPVRSVTKITKEKTAKIIPNAVGVCTEDEVKHIFASLLSRDTTFKLMTRLWKRTVREAGRILEEEDPDLNLMLQGVCINSLITQRVETIFKHLK